jgi:hypothetical protein
VVRRLHPRRVALPNAVTCTSPEKTDTKIIG